MSAGQQTDAQPPDPADQSATYRVDIGQGPAVVGDRNTLVIASYNTYHVNYQGTWTDGVAPPPLADGTGAKRDSPYRGLAVFGEQDAEFFFGRDEAAGQVLERMSQRLSRPGLLMVSGVSGAGKSSLLQAGVLPRIHASGLAGTPEAKNWPCLILTPGREPLAGLASTASLAGVDAATTHQALKADPADFALTARQVAESQPGDTNSPGQAAPGLCRRLLLIVDQLEQLFTQCPDEEQRVAFLAALHAAATTGRGTDHQPAALVVLVVRADFEARCADYPLLAEAVQDRYLVTAMTERQIQLVITGPAEKEGSLVDEHLITVLRDDIRCRARGMAALGPEPGIAAPAGILPLLSHVLDTAWRARAGSSLTLADYDRVGGIERAVADSAERAYKRLTHAQQDAARTIFLRLTATSSDAAITADRATRAEFVYGKNTAKTRDVDAVLEAFAKERLLTLAADAVEISHEVLLRAWPLLRDQWLAGTQADRIVRTRLRAASSEWDRSGRDPSYLYTGTLLEAAAAAAARTYRTRQPGLSQIEHDFLDASKHARGRAAVTRRRALAVLLSLTIGLASIAAVAYNASQNANQASQNAARLRDGAFADQLASESEAQADTNPTASKIESLAAWQIDPTARSRYALVSAAVRPVPSALTANAGLEADWPTFSRDGKMLATSSVNGTVRLWNVVTGQQIGGPLTAYMPGGGGMALAFSPDGRTLATGDGYGTVRLWSVATQQPIGQPLTTDMADGVSSVAFSPDGRTLAAIAAYGTVRLWNVATQQPTGQPLTAGNGEGGSSVAFSPDGRTLATGYEDGTVRLWNLATQHQTGQLTSPRTVTTVDVVAFSPDGRTLATGYEDGTVRLWNLATQQQIGHPFTAGTNAAVDAAAFSPDGRTLATGDADDRVRVWNLATQQQIGQPLSFTTASFPGFYTVAFSPDGQTLAIGVQDGMAWLLNAATRRLDNLPLAQSTTGNDPALAFSPDGQTLAAVDNDDAVRLWNAGTQQQIGHRIALIPDATVFTTLFSVAFSPDGQSLATGGDNLTANVGTVLLWNVATHRRIGQPLTAGTNAAVDAVAFSPDGRTLATGYEDGTVRLWNLATQQQIGHPFTTGTDAVAFSPDGRTLATAGNDGAVRLWDVATQQQIGQPLTDGTETTAAEIADAVAFSPDGRTLAAGYEDGTAGLWDVATQQQIGQPLTDGTETTAAEIADAVAFSPDGHTLAAGYEDGIVRLWDVATQQQIGLPFTVGNGANALAFRPDGRTLVTASAAGIDLWDTNPIEDPLVQVCEQIRGSLTPEEWRQYVPPGPAYSDPCS